MKAKKEENGGSVVGTRHHVSVLHNDTGLSRHTHTHAKISGLADEMEWCVEMSEGLNSSTSCLSARLSGLHLSHRFPLIPSNDVIFLSLKRGQSRCPRPCFPSSIVIFNEAVKRRGMPQNHAALVFAVQSGCGENERGGVDADEWRLDVQLKWHFCGAASAC